MGEFDAESIWRDTNAVMLPRIQGQKSSLTECMDELLWGFTEHDDDIVLMKMQFDLKLKKYLSEAGFYFETLMLRQLEYKEKMDCSIDPYAITPQVLDLCKRMGEANCFPELEIVKKVNSKTYSSNLSSELGCNPYKSYVVHGYDELEKLIRYYIDKPIVIKEPTGVSGQGSLVLENEKAKKSILSFLEKKRRSNNMHFIVEELQDKKIDFSIQAEIKQDGRYTIICMEQILNRGFKYVGTCYFDENLLLSEEREFYFKTIDKVLRRIAKEGYWGNVGIDSMILSNGKVVPLVEINARKTMGLLKHFYQKKFNNSCIFLGSLDVRSDNIISVERIIEILDKYSILYEKNGCGILPLSGNTLNIGDANERIYRGRLYYLDIGSEDMQRVEKLKRALKLGGVDNR